MIATASRGCPLPEPSARRRPFAVVACRACADLDGGVLGHAAHHVEVLQHQLARGAHAQRLGHVEGGVDPGGGFQAGRAMGVADGLPQREVRVPVARSLQGNGAACLLFKACSLQASPLRPGDSAFGVNVGVLHRSACLLQSFAGSSSGGAL
jgi:hypothetical protein